jgi:hypothetical protein
MTLTQQQVEILARYNAEVARGLVHTDEWRAGMAYFQEQLDRNRDQSTFTTTDDASQRAKSPDWWRGRAFTAHALRQAADEIGQHDGDHDGADDAAWAWNAAVREAQEICRRRANDLEAGR